MTAHEQQLTPPGTAPVAELVVKALGRISITGLLVGGSLVALALVQPGKVDAVIIGVIGTLLSISSAAAGALGAILAMTRSAADPPQPVTVVNPPADPVVTTDVEVPEPEPPILPHRPAAHVRVKKRTPAKKTTARKQRTKTT